MAELERVKIIPLIKHLEDTVKKTTYTELELKAPTLSQAEQFYEKQAASTSLAAMRLLIALVTDTRESVLQPMDFIDFRKCEEYLLSFLTWKA
ncbi:phage tail assembly protein [Salmonella enterica]|nr:phage tail assembly protein [Salmonella enterica]EFO5649579.1 phage tail assembly protein [Salmonella enterica subsp. enterica serovar Miami]EDR4377959.1 phage tail assembly protein [Salmonella enterica]EEG5735067.1 phage tail assembly protein [Salmonella enterica]EEG6158926.1 phage tail assembly protein [Salmonella enterica]